MNCDRLKFVYIKSRFNEFYSMSYMQVYIYVLFISIYFTNENISRLNDTGKKGKHKFKSQAQGVIMLLLACR